MSNNNKKKNDTHKLDDTVILSEKDFYPPPDTRCYKSGIDDIRGGDTFKDYAEYFWQEYCDELFDD